MFARDSPLVDQIVRRPFQMTMTLSVTESRFNSFNFLLLKCIYFLVKNVLNGDSFFSYRDGDCVTGRDETASTNHVLKMVEFSS